MGGRGTSSTPDSLVPEGRGRDRRSAWPIGVASSLDPLPGIPPRGYRPAGQRCGCPSRSCGLYETGRRIGQTSVGRRETLQDCGERLHVGGVRCSSVLIGQGGPFDVHRRSRFRFRRSHQHRRRHRRHAELDDARQGGPRRLCARGGGAGGASRGAAPPASLSHRRERAGAHHLPRRRARRGWIARGAQPLRTCGAARRALGDVRLCGRWCGAVPDLRQRPAAGTGGGVHGDRPPALHDPPRAARGHGRGGSAQALRRQEGHARQAAGEGDGAEGDRRRDHGGDAARHRRRPLARRRHRVRFRRTHAARRAGGEVRRRRRARPRSRSGQRW